jgi:hypothetical protein
MTTYRDFDGLPAKGRPTWGVPLGAGPAQEDQLVWAAAALAGLPARERAASLATLFPQLQ